MKSAGARALKARAVTPWSSLRRVIQVPIVPLLRIAGCSEFAEDSRSVTGSGRLARQPKAAMTSHTAWMRGRARAGRSRSLEVEVSIQARRGWPSVTEFACSRMLSMSRLASSVRKGLPVVANIESTTCSAESRRGAGAT